MDILKLVLPVVTFGAGFILNAWLERRKRRYSLSETALRDLVAGLQEWHAAWRDLMVACTKASDSVLNRMG
jgi:hypothetical protein